MIRLVRPIRGIAIGGSERFSPRVKVELHSCGFMGAFCREASWRLEGSTAWSWGVGMLLTRAPFALFPNSRIHKHELAGLICSLTSLLFMHPSFVHTLQSFAFLLTTTLAYTFTELMCNLVSRT